MLLSLSQKEGFFSASDTAYLGFGFASHFLPIYIPLCLSCLLSGNLVFLSLGYFLSAAAHAFSHLTYSYKMCLDCVCLCHSQYCKILMYCC